MPERVVQPVLLREAVRGFEGKWVALKDRRVVEARDTADAVYLALREQGIRGATIMRVPAIGEPELVELG
jgi:Family of unknown function (DUF5678)